MDAVMRHTDVERPWMGLQRVLKGDTSLTLAADGEINMSQCRYHPEFWKSVSPMGDSSDLLLQLNAFRSCRTKNVIGFFAELFQ
jgi:hypothetical protein